MSKKKIIFQHPAIAHYRIPLFKRLLQNDKYDFRIVLNRYETLYPTISQFRNRQILVLNIERNKRWRLELSKIQLFEKYDAIIITLPTSIPSLLAFVNAFLIRRKPYIVWTENWCDVGYPFLYKKLKYKIKTWLYRGVLRNANAVIVSGTKAYNYHYINLGINKNKIFIANQSGEDLLSRNNCSSKLPVQFKKGYKTILYSSRMMLWKGPQVLLKAFKGLEINYPKVQLLMIGDGPALSYCKKIAKEEELQNVIFLGAIPYEKIHYYYKQADVFVLPNTGNPYTEAWGFVFNEATSMGLPVIATEMAGATDDLVEHNVNGYVIPPNDPKKLSESLLKLLKDDDLRRKFGQASRKKFEQYNDYNKMASGFYKAINSIRINKF